MKKYIEILKKCPLFYNIEDENLLGMLSCLDAKVDHFDKKYTVFAEGGEAKYIGIVLSGTAQIIQIDYYGNRSIVASAEPSDMLCDEFACSGAEALPISVIADEPCEIMFIECSHILHTCSHGCSFHHQLIYNLMRGLAQKSLYYYRRLEFTSKRSTREKLLAYLSYQAKKNGSSSFEIPFDRQELADYLEVERSGLSSEISKLQHEGVIKSRKNHFEIVYNYS